MSGAWPGRQSKGRVRPEGVRKLPLRRIRQIGNSKASKQLCSSVKKAEEVEDQKRGQKRKNEKKTENKERKGKRERLGNSPTFPGPHSSSQAPGRPFFPFPPPLPSFPASPPVSVPRLCLCAAGMRPPANGWHARKLGVEGSWPAGVPSDVPASGVRRASRYDVLRSVSRNDVGTTDDECGRGCDEGSEARSQMPAGKRLRAQSSAGLWRARLAAFCSWHAQQPVSIHGVGPRRRRRSWGGFLGFFGVFFSPLFFSSFFPLLFGSLLSHPLSSHLPLFLTSLQPSPLRVVHTSSRRCRHGRRPEEPTDTFFPSPPTSCQNRKGPAHRCVRLRLLRLRRLASAALACVDG